MKPIIEDIVAHAIATMITIGFFATILISLLGFVDLKDATVSSFTGMITGYVAGSLNIVLSRYFKKERLDETPSSRTDKSAQPKPKPQAD